MKIKTIEITFKSGAQTRVAYSPKVYTEMAENLGKDHKVDAPAGYAVQMKEVAAVVYNVDEVPEA